MAEIVLGRPSESDDTGSSGRAGRSRPDQHPMPTVDPRRSRPRLLFAATLRRHGSTSHQTGWYYLAWLPLYERYIVTESLQDASGPVRHRAVGHFPPIGDVMEACRELILAHWADEAGARSRFRVSGVRRAGLVQAAAVVAWSRLIWGSASPGHDRSAAIDELLEARNERSVMGFHRV